MSGREASIRRLWLAAIFLFALAVRAVFLFGVFPNAPRLVPGLYTAVGMSFDGYDAIARRSIPCCSPGSTACSGRASPLCSGRTRCSGL